MPIEPDDLYGLPFDRFVAERTALVKALRAAERRDEAASVAARRKPSAAAWAVNQLVRTQARDVDALFVAGDGLIAAQSDLLAGRGDARTLRAAGDGERAAIARLVDAARGLLSSQGQELSAPIVQRVADTLHAAALDESARGQVRGGCLEHELRHVGLQASRNRPESVQARSLSAAGRLGRRVDVFSSAPFAFGPQIGVAPDGRAVFAWGSADGDSDGGPVNNRIQARARSATGALGPVVTLSDSADVDSGSAPHLAVAANANAIATWEIGFGFGRTWRARAAAIP